MLIAQVMRNGWEGPRRHGFASETATLLKGAGTAILLVEGDLEPSIGHVWRARGRMRLDWRGGAAIYVNGRSVDAAYALEPEDEVRVGLFRYRFWFGELPATVDRTPYVATGPTEQQLIDELAHPAARGVYADWLEQRGAVAQAAFLRIQDALINEPAERAEELGGRLAALAGEVTAGWRTIVANPPIERCGARFRFACPRQWGDLVRTDRDDVRHCRTCARDVYYAISVGEARTRAKAGHCVALDLTSPRWRDDLEPPYLAPCRACGADRSPRYPAFGCDHCGARDAQPGVEID